MAKFVIWFLGLALTFASFPESDGVWELDSKSLDEALKIQPDLLVEFYAPWCAHCQKFEPEYAKLASMLNKESPPIKIARIDASKYDEVASKYTISGFPTLKFFTKGDVLDHTESKNADALYEYVLRKSRSNVKVFTTRAELNQLTSTSKVNVVLFAANQTDPVNLFESLSKEYSKINFLFTDSQNLAEEFGVSQPHILLIRSFDEERVDYTGDLREFPLKKFINLNKTPLVLEFKYEAVEILFRDSNPGIFLLTNSYSKYESIFRKTAEKFKPDLYFIQDDLHTAFEGKLSMFLGIDAKEQPLVLIVDPKDEMKQYRLDQTISLASLETFINSWKENSLKPAPLSEPVPLQPYDNGVKVLVRSNFNKVVLDDTLDVLVEFYAPWCGHCNDLKPKYEELAAIYKDNPMIVIAKIDSTKNEIDGLDIQGYPTIILFPADIKQGVLYEGDPTLEGLQAFIKEKARYYVDVGRGNLDL